jgi:hypothetical protein
LALKEAFGGPAGRILCHLAFDIIGSAVGSDSGRICEAIAPAPACRAGWGARLSEEKTKR